jgi:histidyl-tRNA synthetase
MKLQAPRGTFDVLPDDGRRRLMLEGIAADVLGRAGYEPFDTPIFEDTEVFARGVGAATDIVQKEMFTFEDKAGRSLTLRPEATAAICRAYIEHGMHKQPQPIKLWTWGPFFRHEAPQAGRYRQFTQLDAEALGSNDPSLDAELILLLAEFIERAGAGPARLRLSSLGSPETRAEYLRELTAYLRAREGELSEEVRERLDQNPLRAFDADHPGTRAVMEDAPRLLDRLEDEDAEHFARVRSLLEASGMQYEIDSTLVRGLDYYTRTVFEFESERLGAQAALGGGGRYDRLIDELGGPATPGVGWAAGIERILLAASRPSAVTVGPAVETDIAVPIGVYGGAPRVFVAFARPEFASRAFAQAQELRQNSDLRDRGIDVQLEQAGRSLKGQLKHANRINAHATVIVGDSIEVKNMQSGAQQPASEPDEVARLVKEALA